MASEVVNPITLSKKESLRKHSVYKRFRSKVFPPVIAFIVFITLWQFVLQLFNIPSYLLPKPIDIISAAFGNSASLIDSVLTTAIESVLGFLLSIIIGVSSAVLLASSRIIEKSIYPYAVILQTVPIVAIAPIIVIWFGAGINSIIVITFLISFFPMLSNTLIGLHSTDQNLKNLFYLYNANRWQLMWRLRIPGALPYIVGGLKVSCTLSVIGAIVGEYIAGIGGSQGGLGYAITSAAMRLETPYLFACGLSASLLGISFFLIINFISKRLLSSWHESEMKIEN
ncbi:ABC transporter permease [Metabacillus fastidiosus]|uniref:ABC transporter permease n=1 Tax=Metabacillus fastidiosus TaxID=1458 RepID=UPI002E1C330C|nr:ABC transporter permease [Metabacillus fastidiosus]